MIRLAFASRLSTSSDVAVLADRLARWGYDAADLEFSNSGSSDPALVAAVATTTLPVCCVSVYDEDAAPAARRAIALAVELSAPIARIVPAAPRKVGWFRFGSSRAAHVQSLADVLRPLADDAADRGVLLAVEATAPGLGIDAAWHLAELIDHPAFGLSWTTRSPAEGGPDPSVVVSVLNSRLVHVRVRDVAADGTTPARLGEGTVAVERLLARLRGIGYAGAVSAAWDEANVPEDFYADALAKLKRWALPPAPAAKRGAKRGSGTAAK